MKLITKDVGPQPRYRVRTRKGAHLLYTYEQAMALAGDVKRQRVRKGDPDISGKKPEPYQPDKTGKQTNLRKAEIDKPLSGGPKKRTQKREGEDNADKHVKFMCLLCKDNNRRFNHPPDKCNYARGGI